MKRSGSTWKMTLVLGGLNSQTLGEEDAVFDGLVCGGASRAKGKARRTTRSRVVWFIGCIDLGCEIWMHLSRAEVVQAV
jgi:hypothetical protein